jgi:hypothetical protein
VFLVLDHNRRRVVHFNVTARPTAEWTAQQLRQAFPFDVALKYLLRDRDGIFGSEFGTQVAHLGMEKVLSAPRLSTANFIYIAAANLMPELQHERSLWQSIAETTLSRTLAFCCMQSAEVLSPVLGLGGRARLLSGVKLSIARPAARSRSRLGWQVSRHQ